MTYYARPNDLIGGWIVTPYNKPMSEHNTPEGECPIADFWDEDHAKDYALMLNHAEDGNLVYRTIERRCDGDCREHHSHVQVHFNPFTIDYK
jgi:hypothetical protein